MGRDLLRSGCCRTNLFFLVLLVGLGYLAQPAIAKPGQTQAQLVRWMQANPAFTMQKHDAAKITVEGFHANFSAFPIGDTVAHEQISFINMAPNWELNRTWTFNTRVLKDVYGEDVAEDVVHPVKGFAARNISLRLGKLYAYAGFSHTLMVYRRSSYEHLVLQIKGCGRVEC